MRRWSWALLASFAVAAACGSFGEGPTGSGETVDSGDDGAVLAEGGPEDGAANADAAADGDLDANETDAGVVKPSLTCLAPDHYCADFETADSGFVGTDDVSCGACTIAVDGAKSYRGTKSLKVHLASGDSNVKNRNVDAPSLGGFFVRFFVHVPVNPPDYLRVVTVTTKGGHGFELGVDHEGRLTSSVYTPAVVRTSVTSIVGPTFRCVEWHVTNTLARAYVDDQEVVAVTQMRTPASGTDTLKTLGVGLFYYELMTNVATDVWYDDLVVSPTRVGCTR